MKIGSKKYLLTVVQYPFLKYILSQKMEPYNGDGGLSTTEIIVEAEKANGDLLFRRADNVGLGNLSCILYSKGKRKGQVMRRGEYLFIVDRSGKIINRVNWPRNEEEEEEETKVSAIYGWRRQVDISNDLKYFVWVTVEAWHSDKKNDDAPNDRVGDFKENIIKITIYSTPKQGFEKLERESDVYWNLLLDNKLMKRGVIDKNLDIVTIGGMLSEMCITFQEEVYLNGMKKVLDEGKYRGASGQFGTVKVFCADDCITLKDSTSYITFELRPCSKYVCVHGKRGTLPQIRNLVRTVVRMWREDPESRETFKSNKNVSVV